MDFWILLQVNELTPSRQDFSSYNIINFKKTKKKSTFVFTKLSFLRKVTEKNVLLGLKGDFESNKPKPSFEYHHAIDSHNLQR